MVRKSPAREAAEAEQKRTTAKLARLRRKGVDVSSIDPRRDLSTMNSRQVAKYADQLRSFNSNRGYVAGLNGAPIGRAAYQQFETLQRRNNAVSQGYEKTVGKVVVPSLGQDVASQINRRDKERFTMGGEQATFQKMFRKAADITGQDSMMRLIDGLRKKLRPNYLNDRMNVYRQNLETMFQTTNDDTGIEMFAELSDQQLNVLVDYTPFMNAMSGRYEFMKALNADEQFKPENWMTEIFETNTEEVHDLLHWAKTGINVDEKTDNDSTTQYSADRRRRIVPRKRGIRKRSE